MNGPGFLGCGNPNCQVCANMYGLLSLTPSEKLSEWQRMLNIVKVESGVQTAPELVVSPPPKKHRWLPFKSKPEPEDPIQKKLDRQDKLIDDLRNSLRQYNERYAHFITTVETRHASDVIWKTQTSNDLVRQAEMTAPLVSSREDYKDVLDRLDELAEAVEALEKAS